MQMDATDAFDLSSASPNTIRDLYGNARPMGVRLWSREALCSSAACATCSSGMELASPGTSHDDLEKPTTAKLARRSATKPIGGLLTDLKQRGMLEDTLVMWGGEFGRTPVGRNAQQRQAATRARSTAATTTTTGSAMWLAGGGVKAAATVHGSTDEFGFRAADQSGPRARPARDPAALARLRPRGLHLSLCRPRFPPHRCRRAGGGRDRRVTRSREIA